MPQKKWVTITKYNASAIQLRIQNKHKTPSLWCDFHIKWTEDVILDDDDNSDANDDGDNGDNDDYDDDDDGDDDDDDDDDDDEGENNPNTAGGLVAVFTQGLDDELACPLPSHTS